ncbi:peptidase C14 [Colletotrichum cereale]|nr:peptidase C14 [Colletotrichum cereale]
MLTQSLSLAVVTVVLYLCLRTKLAQPQFTSWLGPKPSSQTRLPVHRASRGVRVCQVYPTQSHVETDIDIIAVHGLDTNSPETWEDRSKGKSTVNWLADKGMLPQEVSRARIFTCDWPADLFRDPNVEENRMDELARLLLEGILGRPQATDKQPKNRPILFIASCFGGIILMKALNMACGRYLPIQEDTRGIVFLATPFHGTSFGEVAGWAEPSLRAWASVRGQQATRLLDWVKSPIPRLTGLRADFNTLCRERSYHVRIFYEKGYTDLSRKLVDFNSATLDYVPDPLPLERNHVRMNKFRGPKDSDPDYKLVVDQIRHCLEEIRKRTPLQKADDHIRYKHYSEEKLRIERLSGGLLEMDQCYTNLALVELQRADNSERRSNEPSLRSSPFSLSDRLKVETPHKDLQVELVKLFESRKLPGGNTQEPRRILIQGRAGVGKTTLCKKIVHNYIHESMWREQFTRLLWVQLRRLKTWSGPYNLGEMLRHIYLEQCQDSASLAKELWGDIKDDASCQTLFVLDGLDEVSELLDPDHNAFGFLVGLLNRSNVILTTRPHTRLPSDVKTPDLELDTYGFYPDQVQKYLEAVLPKDDAEKIRSFLQKNRLLQSLVRIPIQLDALCLTWNESLEVDPIPETMTAVYKAIVERLWRKDIKRIDKEKNTKDLLSSEVAKIAEPENKLLEGLAFSGLHSNVIEFQPAHRDALHKHSWPLQIKIRLNEMFGRLSFLRTSDPSADPSTRSYHFLHLTFHEYFAAKYFARKWKYNQNLQYLDFNHRKNNCREISCEAFLKQHKYTARYDIFWRFVAGLLDDEGEDESTRFFKALERKPVDLLGPTHQRLVMNCLREAVFLPFEIRSNREKRLKDWVLFEINLTGSSTFTRESELPDGVLQGVLGASRKKRTIVDSLGSSGRHMSETTMTALAELIKDEDINVRHSAASTLGEQSTLSETTMTALVELFKHEDSDVRRYAASALGTQSNLMDKVLDALGLVIRSESQADMQASVFCYPQHIGPLYRSFLWRSFQEQFSLYIDDSLCIVNQPSGLRMADFGDSSQVQTAVQNGQCNLRNIGRYKLWDTFEGEDA